MWQIISNYIGVLILGIGEILFAKIVLEKEQEISISKTILLLLLVTLISTISSTYMDGIINTFLLAIVHIFEFKILFNLSFTSLISTFSEILTLTFGVFFSTTSFSVFIRHIVLRSFVAPH